MEVTLELNCELGVLNRQGGVIEHLSRGSITVTSVDEKSTPSEESCITVRTSPDNTGTKYNLTGNIEEIFTQFLNEGQVTISLKEPSYDIIITNAEVNELKTFIVCFKMLLPKVTPVHVSIPELEPLTCPVNLILGGQKNYKIKMENILRRNTNLDQFTDLEIHNCTLELEEDYQVPIADAIMKMKNLTTLCLENVKLCSSTFLEIESKELKWLHLCKSEAQLPIASLFKNDLCYKDSLVELHLEGNQWSEIPNGIFEFGNLLKLSLSYNLITELPDKFINLPKLQLLSLCHNRLTHVPSCILSLQNLLKLLLSDNLITELPDMFANLSKLQVLSLSFNQLQCLPPCIFEFRNLSELSLNNNRISELPDMFVNLSKLRVLSLSFNQIGHLPPSIFALKSLSELFLSSNFITELPDMLNNFPKLNTLELSNNRLRSLPPSIFTLRNLCKLSFNGNRITKLPDKFANLSKLKYLSLSWNRLKYLPLSICALNLRTLDIESNPFNYEIPPAVGSEMNLHSLKELSYRTILNHNLVVKKGMLPKKLLKNLFKYHKCVCGSKYVGEGQDFIFSYNLNNLLSYIRYNPNANLRFIIRGKMCTSLKSCFLDRFSKCK